MSDMEEIIEAAHEAWVNDPDANPHFVDDSEQSLTQAIAQALTQAGYGRVDVAPTPDEPTQPVPDELVEAVAAMVAEAERINGDPHKYLHALARMKHALTLAHRTEAEVRAEYLKELIRAADDQCAKITDNSPMRIPEGLGAACWLRSHTQGEE